MESVRAFIAIELPQPIKSAISRLQGSLRQCEPSSVKWVDADSVHLTLKFLGNVASETIPEITGAVSSAVAEAGSFELVLSDPGTFPNLRAPRVVWVGLSGETAALSALHKSVEQALVPLGYPPEKRGFSPHLTLGRVRESASPGQRQRLGGLVASLRIDERPSFTVEAVNLMKSTLTRERAIYSRLALLPLKRG